jgi:hypothetical protein
MRDWREATEGVAIQASGTLVGGLLLLVVAKAGGLLSAVDWISILKASATAVIAGLLVAVVYWSAGYRSPGKQLQDDQVIDAAERGADAELGQKKRT